MAERVGFEPTIPVKVYTLSKPGAPALSRLFVRATISWVPLCGEAGYWFFSFGARVGEVTV